MKSLCEVAWGVEFAPKSRDLMTRFAFWQKLGEARRVRAEVVDAGDSSVFCGGSEAYVSRGEVSNWTRKFPEIEDLRLDPRICGESTGQKLRQECCCVGRGGTRPCLERLFWVGRVFPVKSGKNSGNWPLGEL